MGDLQHFKCYLQRNLARKFKEIWRDNFLLLSPPTFSLGALADVVKKEVVKQNKFFFTTEVVKKKRIFTASQYLSRQHLFFPANN